MLALMLLALSAAPDALADETLMHFSRASVRGRNTVEVSVGRIAGVAGDPPRYWLRRRDGSQTVTWTDTQTCPAALSVLRDAAALEPPRPVIPGLDDHRPVDVWVVADGAGYALTVVDVGDHPATTLTLTSNVGTPLAKWIDASLTRLGPCWSSTPPEGVDFR